jgi:hypothetical protein
MRKCLLLIALSTMATVAESADNIFVNYDNLPGENMPVPQGYGGINWNNNWIYYGFVDPPYTAHSLPNRVYDLAQYPSDTFTFVNPNGDIFGGAWFAGYGFATVQFVLYNGLDQMWTSEVLSPSDVPTFLSSGYFGLVTTVEVQSPSPDFFVMDDVTYSTGLSTPEPSTLTLFSAGLVGAAGAVLRKRRG